MGSANSAGCRRPLRVWILMLLVTGLAGASGLEAQVTSERLVKALDEPSNWLHYRGDYSGQNHRPLDQITTENVKNLKVKWVFQTGDGNKARFETVPLVLDEVMYLTAAHNNGMPWTPGPGESCGDISGRSPRRAAAADPSTGASPYSVRNSTWRPLTAIWSPSTEGQAMSSGMLKWATTGKDTVPRWLRWW